MEALVAPLARRAPTGQSARVADEHDRLLHAVEQALLPALPSDFAVSSVRSGNRGSSVALHAPEVTLNVTSDWIEGELVVKVQRAGEPPSEVCRRVRLGRGVSARALQSKLSAAMPLILEAINSAD